MLKVNERCLVDLYAPISFGGTDWCDINQDGDCWDEAAGALKVGSMALGGSALYIGATGNIPVATSFAVGSFTLAVGSAAFDYIDTH